MSLLDDAIHTRYEPTIPHGIISDLIMSGGDVWLPRDHYGAELFKSSGIGWSINNYPQQAYSEGVDTVAISDDYVYYGQ